MGTQVNFDNISTAIVCSIPESNQNTCARILYSMHAPAKCLYSLSGLSNRAIANRRRNAESLGKYA